MNKVLDLLRKAQEAKKKESATADDNSKFVFLLQKILADITAKPQIKGDKGDMPVKGVDYFTPQDVEAFLIASTPVLGKDYFTEQEKKDLLAEITPQKGVHYFDGEPGPEGKQGPPGKSIKGPQGEPGKDGAFNEDQVHSIVQKGILGHETEIDHSLLHDPFTLGNLKVDETDVKDGSVLVYNEKDGKRVLSYMQRDTFVPHPKQWFPSDGVGLPNQHGNSGKFLTTDGTVSSWAPASGGSGTPGGLDTQVQFNDASTFGGDTGLTYNKTTDTLTVGTGISFSTNGVPTDRTIVVKNQTTVDIAGNALSIIGSDGKGIGSGGNINLTAGAGDTTGGGGGLILSGGLGGATSGQGGTLALVSGDAQAGNSPGGDINFTGGLGDGSGTGGNLFMGSGNGGDSGDGGLVNLYSGNGGTGGGNGGDFAYDAGRAGIGGGGRGGKITFTGGKGDGANVGGDINFTSGNGGTSGGTGGNFYFQAGAGGGNIVGVGNTGDGGSIQLAAGSAYGSGFSSGDAFLSAGNGGDDANGGNVILSAGGGNGTGTNGQIQVYSAGNTKKAILDFDSIASSDKTFTFPNNSGTIALTSDTPSGTKITALTSLTTPASNDLLVIVDDPGGTPTTKKITVANLFTYVAIPSLSRTFAFMGA